MTQAPLGVGASGRYGWLEVSNALIGGRGEARRRRLLVVGAVSVLAILSLVAAGKAAKDDTTLISIAQVVPGGKGNGFSGEVSPSADGEIVAFSTTSNNLVAEDTSIDEDVYVRDTAADTTTLITPGDGPDPGGGTQPSISGDGTRVAFMSFEDLTADDTNNQRDVYVFDFATGETTLASRPTGTGPAPPVGSSSPAISGDGRVVAFVSADNTLDPTNDNDTTAGNFFSQDVFVREIDNEITDLVSRNASTDGDRASARPSIDENGNHVSFDTQAANLSPADTDGELDVYVRDRVAGTLTLASRADGALGGKANDETQSSSMSGDGSAVAFISAATNLDSDDSDSTFDVYVRELLTRETELVSRASGVSGAKANKIAQGPTISRDGDQVAFISPADNLDPDQPDVTSDNQAYVRNRDTDATKLQSRADGVSGPIADEDVGEAAISSEGDDLAFGSRATNLDAGDTDTIQDAFVRKNIDSSGDTVLVSQSPVEPPVNANGESRDPSISADGRYVAFSSVATNIDPDAGDGVSQIFVRDTTSGLTVLASRASAAGPAGDQGSSSTVDLRGRALRRVRIRGREPGRR